MTTHVCTIHHSIHHMPIAKSSMVQRNNWSPTPTLAHHSMMPESGASKALLALSSSTSPKWSTTNCLPPSPPSVHNKPKPSKTLPRQSTSSLTMLPHTWMTVSPTKPVPWFLPHTPMPASHRTRIPQPCRGTCIFLSDDDPIPQQNGSILTISHGIGC